MRSMCFLAGIALASSVSLAQFAIVSSFNPTDRGAYIAVAYSEDTEEVFAYSEFGAAIDVYSRAGTFLRTITRPGPSSNDIDLEVAAASLNVGGTVVPRGTLLVLNAENTSTQTLFALNTDGTVLASRVLTVAGQCVGGTYHQARGTFFVVDWTSETIREMDAASGLQLAAFSINSSGNSTFDVFYGDMDSLRANGDLFVVSTSQASIRELTPTGTFVRDINVSTFGLNSMAGIAFDDRRGEAWIASRDGSLTLLAGFPSDTSGCLADWNQDATVDGDDVLSFFEQWDQNNADFNGDGATDGDDVIGFFVRWDSGC